ncbi:PREDICTED: GDSL esterase/lipase At3g26430-like [Prunus mume]|uniref:GDSL esterase/lipase At3g26430-like n=1 Tax=Prunus mume TaxID=102107 RepID=A0ABM0NAK5_PRUMU|nr:PREDICTED: GDSL esterase/lipase At3g26430-like [Prunus mume]
MFSLSLCVPYMIMESHFSKTLVVAILVSLSVSLAPCLVLASTSCKFPAIFNFGDSNSDTGGFSAVFGQARPPHGESYFHGPAGRYCDGRLVIDFIANSLGLPFLSAYLDSVGSNFSHGANFATAASTIRPQNTTLHQSGFSPISLDVQYDEFYDFPPRSQIVRSQGGVFEQLMPKAEDFSRALYTFDIGQNDLAAGFFFNMSTAQVKAYVPDVLNQFKSIVKNVYDQGGRYFWIHNTGPVGCLPYVLARLPVLASQVDKAGCATPYNEVAQFFNHGLKEVVVQLREELPLAAITYVDIYSAKYSLISQPKKHGFEQPIRACCGQGGKYNNNLHCGGKIKVHGREILVGKACQDPSLWVNWDGFHYTQAANKRVFDQIVDGSFSDPPVPLKMVCHRQQQAH